MTPEGAVYGAWGLWLLSWLVAAGWSSAPAKRAGWAREAQYRVPQLLGFAALLAYRSSGSAADDGRLNGFLWTRLWEAPSTFGWTMVGLAVCGFVFCWWARLHLGRLWSGTVTRKEGHRVVDTGPYALVRHPIYTGLLAAAIATAALKATPLAVAGTLLIAVGLVLKAQLEEKFLREELGAESYDAYRRRVPMLVPFT